MIKWKEIAGPSCLTSADINEPIFTLRANDELAPDIVRAWADRYMASKKANGEMTQKQRDKYVEARALASEMERWKKDRGEAPYWVRTFWSPDRKHLVTVHVSGCEDVNIIGFQDDNGHEWEPASEQQNMASTDSGEAKQ